MLIEKKLQLKTKQLMITRFCFHISLKNKQNIEGIVLWKTLHV